MDSSSIQRIPVAARHPTWVLASAAVVLSVVLCLAFAEIVLNFLPVSSGLRSMPVDAANPVFHFEPNRSYVFSQGWNLEYVTRGRLNNAGWVNEQDYRKDDPTPLVAVVGDSYIEALHVPYAESMQGRLAQALAGEFRVYSFAAAGAPLSQYLIWARHAVSEYGARAVVINVIENDFDESHAAYKTRPGFWHYVPDGNGELQLRLFTHHRGMLWTLAQKSALARYLLIHLTLNRYFLDVPLLRSLFVGRPAHAQPSGASGEVESRHLKDSYAVIDAFVRDLAQLGLPPDRIVLVIDGFRYPDSVAASTGTYFDRMRQALRVKAQARGYEVIDLDPFFFAHHRQHGQTFEFPRDGHWNETGHAVAAQAILSSRMLKGLRESR